MIFFLDFLTKMGSTNEDLPFAGDVKLCPK